MSEVVTEKDITLMNVCVKAWAADVFDPNKYTLPEAMLRTAYYNKALDTRKQKYGYTRCISCGKFHIEPAEV